MAPMNRHWRIVEVNDEPRDTDLTDGELVGMSVLLTHKSGEPHDDTNVYWRARTKIQPQVEIALEGDDEDPGAGLTRGDV